MAREPIVHFKHIHAASKRLTNAHAAVVAGIATHAQKNQAARQELFLKMEQERRLSEGARIHNAPVQTDHS